MYCYDPACLAINQVFSAAGDLKFVSGDTEYNKYISDRTDLKILWTCKDDNQ